MGNNMQVKDTDPGDMSGFFKDLMLLCFGTVGLRNLALSSFKTSLVFSGNRQVDRTRNFTELTGYHHTITSDDSI